ncbi:cytochrome P450 2B4-like [Polypterus senegalus]|uniref:cytochrome P450 2B4-like n=1 Tax=Polypterus senegalus TaxID=55291 RepID=UPI0019640EF4|nr:cytochrome P450 2B4-like [Polypterus senegalus]
MELSLAEFIPAGNSYQAVTAALVFGAAFLLFYEVFRLWFPKYKRPPGPTSLPLIGSLQFFIDPMRTFLQMKEKYGDISCIFLGRKPVILLNEFGIMKDVLIHSGAEFAGRPEMAVIELITHGLGIVMAPYGIPWKQQRKFALQTLRNFGLGKKSLEERISEEAMFLIEELQKESGKAFNPHSTINNAVSNIICSIVFGNRFDYDDEKFKYLLRLVNFNVQNVGSPAAQLFELFPILRHFPGPHQKILRNADEILEFVQQSVNEHRKTLDPDNLRDFVDAYIVEIEKQRSNPAFMFTDENLIITIGDLFLAGSDTTTTTVRWGLLYMTQHPEIQEKCFQEIISKVGFNRLPSYEDRINLPFVEATINEIQRMGNIAPFGVPREVTKDTELRGYFLPKGTQVFINLSSVFYDKSIWKFPDQFNPENFLDDEGNFYRPELFIPFSAGMRMCPGEQLARVELFIFFSSLLQHLKFCWPDGASPPDLEGIVGLSHSPKPFKLLCQTRDWKKTPQ